MVVSAALILAAGWCALAQTPPPFQIRVETNVVMVRVVVRDAKGRPVAGLRKENFRVSDSGKPQQITGFAVETGNAGASAAVAAPAAPNPPPGTATAPATPVPQRFVALYFDDLHMEAGAVGQTRDAAWRYISTKLRPDDRVALFTSSNTSKRGIVDFTDDRVKLHDALFRLAPHSRTNPQTNQCPSIGEYQAYLIAVRQQSDALEIAVEEGYSCHCKGINETGECRNSERVQAQGSADQIWGLADRQSQDALDVMDGVVNLLAARPGQRTLVLVSSGFLTATREKSIDALIDRALRRNVVVNAIDAAGLFTKTYHNPILMARPDLDREKFRVENEAVSVQRDVLAALAQGTGGTFFHNSNDFDDGLRQTAQAPEVYYVLSFSPQDVKLDGRFHPLKVTLNTGDGWDIKARRGYYADTTLAEKNPTKTELESMVYSQDERQDLPATVTAQVEQPGGGAPALTVKIHVDIGAVEFRKEADRSVDTLTFDTAVFDRDGKYVAGKESSLDFRLTDAKLEELAKSGINAQTSFRVAPGTYRVREVVRDTGSKKTSALNCNVEVTASAPIQTAVSTEPAAPKKETENQPLLRTEIAPVGPAPGDLPRETVLLAAFKRKIRQVLTQIPNYTCLETVQRSVQRPRANALSPIDIVLLEVSTVGDKELLAWPGARRFEEGNVSSFASGGMIGSGVFASHARNVFLVETTTMQYHGDEEVSGRMLARFDFRVPESWSGYQIQANGASAKVGTTGSFWIDPASLELVRMEVRADDIPAAIGIERTETDIDYAPVRIGDSDILLPQAAKILVALPTGEVRRNDIQFSHCHEYLTESTIRFDMPDTAAARPAQQWQTVDLPAGLTVSIELDTAVDSATAHIGDILRGHVTSDVRRKGKTIIPKGAIATGRVRGIERSRAPGPAVDLTIEIAELEWENSRAQFYGELVPPASAREGENSLINLPSKDGGVPDVVSSAGHAAETVHAPQIPGTGVLHLTGKQLRIAAGFRMDWRTWEPNQRVKKPK
jgi:VWFA-related protein